ncbi:11241_t:CDS:2, partial [Funneliformis geosporum]
QEAIDLETTDYLALKVVCQLLHDITGTTNDNREEIALRVAAKTAKEAQDKIEAAINEAKNNDKSAQIKTLYDKLIALNETESEHEKKVLTDNAALQTELNDTIANDTEEPVEIEITDLTEAERNRITADDNTPEKIKKARQEIITNYQKDRTEKKELVKQITDTLAKFHSVSGNNAELETLKEKIKADYDSWKSEETAPSLNHFEARYIKSLDIFVILNNIDKAIGENEKRERRKKENDFIADFKSMLLNSDRKDADGAYND